MTDPNTSITATPIPGGPQPAAMPPAVPDFASSSAAAMNPAFADAGQTASNQKAALLTAIAQAGSAGARQFQALQAQNDQDKQAALQAATQREAVVQNMPPALAQQLGLMTGSGFDLNKTLMGDTAQTFGQTQGILSQSAGNYMDELKAGIPVVEANTQAKIAALQEQAFKQDSANSAANIDATTGLPKSMGDVQSIAQFIQNGLDSYRSEHANDKVNTGTPNLQGTQMSPHASDLTPPLQGDLDKAYYAQVDAFFHKPSGWAQSVLQQGSSKTQSQNAAAGIKQFQLNADQNGTAAKDARAGIAQQVAQAAVDYATSKGISDPSQIAQAVINGVQSQSPPGAPPLSPTTAQWAVNQALATAIKGSTAGTGS